MTKIKHLPVMLAEVIGALEIKANQWYLDATFGQGGHTQKILNLGGRVAAFDYDKQNIQAGAKKFVTEINNGSLILIRENFDQLAKVIATLRLKISGILFDFGTTSEQLTSAKKGLSFSDKDQELDMRLDQRLGVKAKDLLAVMGQKQLQKIFEVYGGETEARSIAKEIIKRRKAGNFITRVEELVNLITTTKHHLPRQIHPATKVFQALRIAVNDELDNIKRALPQALAVLQPKKNLVTIAFHEGEDRLVKNYFKNWGQKNLGRQTHKKVITPTMTEIKHNQKSRSAKMRIFKKN